MNNNRTKKIRKTLIKIKREKEKEKNNKRKNFKRKKEFKKV